MIDIVSGHVGRIEKDSVVVMVGGVGLRIRVPKTVFDTLGQVGSGITLFTHLVIREDDMSLFGFATQEERGVFEILITIGGIGPRTAVAILSTLSIDQLRSAVAREEASILTRVPGIGKKTADKIMFELKSKMRIDGEPALALVSDIDTDVIAALTALGYSIVEAQSAIQSISRDAPRDVETRIMLALQYFG